MNKVKINKYLVQKTAGIIIVCCFLLSGCKKDTTTVGTPIYLEVEQMDPKVEKCFKEKLYNKWASIKELFPHNQNEKYVGKHEEKHIFKSYNDFDVDKDAPGTEKLMVRVYGEGDTSNTFFQVQGYKWQSDGIWQRVINLGNFRIPDRQNDTINPGKVDEEEICNHLVHICILASFK